MQAELGPLQCTERPGSPSNWRTPRTWGISPPLDASPAAAPARTSERALRRWRFRSERLDPLGTARQVVVGCSVKVSVVGFGVKIRVGQLGSESEPAWAGRGAEENVS